MTNKMTNREMFVMVLTVITNANIADDEKAMLTEFINSRIEQIDKKAGTVTKAQREKDAANAALSDMVYAALLKTDRLIKVGELIKGTPELSEYSTQKITPILSTLIANGKVERVTVKRENLYRVMENCNAAGDDAEDIEID